MFFLSIKPFSFDALIFRILNKLVNDIVNFKTDTLWLVSNYDSFHPVEVAHEAVLLEEKIVFETLLAV